MLLRRFAPAVALALAMGFIPAGQTQDVTAEFPTDFTLPTDALTAVVTYSYTPAELAGDDTTTTLQVYPDGRVVVDVAGFLKTAGRHEARLSPGELRDLMAGLVSDDLITFDPFQTTLQRQQEIEQYDELTAIADGARTNLELRLASYVSTTQGLINAPRAQVSWANLQHEASLSSIPALQRAAAAERRLQELLDAVVDD